MKTNWSSLMAGLVCAGLLASTGCYSRTVEKETIVKEAPPAAAPIIIQSETMPPVRVEEPGPPPGPTYSWVSGYWEKTGGGWVWHPGHWQAR